MATFTITIADAKVPLIQAARAQWNAEHGTSLTMEQWVKRLVANEVLKGDAQDAISAVLRRKEKETAAEARAAEETVLAGL